MGFRDPFQYRTCSDIDNSYPDLQTPKWNLKKIKKVKTTNLKLISNINGAPYVQHLRIDTIWLAQFYFQRYFTQNSFQENTPLVFLAACLHLACKANDTPRSLDKLIKGSFKQRYQREETEANKIDDVMVFVEFKVCLSICHAHQHHANVLNIQHLLVFKTPIVCPFTQHDASRVRKVAAHHLDH